MAKTQAKWKQNFSTALKVTIGLTILLTLLGGWSIVNAFTVSAIANGVGWGLVACFKQKISSDNDSQNGQLTFDDSEDEQPEFSKPPNNSHQTLANTSVQHITDYQPPPPNSPTSLANHIQQVDSALKRQQKESPHLELGGCLSDSFVMIPGYKAFNANPSPSKDLSRSTIVPPSQNTTPTQKKRT